MVPLVFSKQAALLAVNGPELVTSEPMTPLIAKVREPAGAPPRFCKDIVPPPEVFVPRQSCWYGPVFGPLLAQIVGPPPVVPKLLTVFDAAVPQSPITPVVTQHAAWRCVTVPLCFTCALPMARKAKRREKT